MSKNKRTLQRRKISMLIAHFFVVFIVIALLLLQINNEVEKKFINTLHTEFNKFELKVESQADALYLLRSFFILNENVSNDEWQFFLQSHNISHRFPKLGDLSYIEFITDNNILNRNLYNNLSTNNEHFIMKYTTADQSIINTDIGFQPERYQTIMSAIKNNQIVITEPVISFIDGSNKIVMYLPIYNNSFDDDMNPESRLKNVKGIVSLSMPMNDFISEIFDDYMLENFDVRVVSKENNTLIYHNHINFSEAIRPLTQKVTVKVGGKFWEISVQVNFLFFVENSTRLIILIMIFGGLFTNITAYSIILSYRRSKNAESR